MCHWSACHAKQAQDLEGTHKIRFLHGELAGPLPSASDLGLIYPFMFLRYQFFSKFHPFLSTLFIPQRGFLSSYLIMTCYFSLFISEGFSHPPRSDFCPSPFCPYPFFSSFTLLSQVSTLYFTFLKLSFPSKPSLMFDAFLQMFFVSHVGICQAFKLTFSLPRIFALNNSRWSFPFYFLGVSCCKQTNFTEILKLVYVASVWIPELNFNLNVWNHEKERKSQRKST